MKRFAIFALLAAACEPWADHEREAGCRQRTGRACDGGTAGGAAGGGTAGGGAAGGGTAGGGTAGGGTAGGGTAGGGTAGGAAGGAAGGGVACFGPADGGNLWSQSLPELMGGSWTAAANGQLYWSQALADGGIRVKRGAVSCTGLTELGETSMGSPPRSLAAGPNGVFAAHGSGGFRFDPMLVSATGLPVKNYKRISSNPAGDRFAGLSASGLIPSFDFFDSSGTSLGSSSALFAGACTIDDFQLDGVGLPGIGAAGLFWVDATGACSSEGGPVATGLNVIIESPTGVRSLLVTAPPLPGSPLALAHASPNLIAVWRDATGGLTAARIGVVNGTPRVPVLDGGPTVIATVVPGGSLQVTRMAEDPRGELTLVGYYAGTPSFGSITLPTTMGGTPTGFIAQLRHDLTVRSAVPLFPPSATSVFPVDAVHVGGQLIVMVGCHNMTSADCPLGALLVSRAPR